MGKYISHPDEVGGPSQTSFLGIPGYAATRLQVHPRIQRDKALLHELLGTPQELGIDLEFDFWRGPGGRMVYKPTILGIATRTKIYGGVWDDETIRVLRAAFLTKGFTWIAYAGVSADKPVVEQALGIETSLDIWKDSMQAHYLANMHLVKQPDKDESDDSGSLGMMDLWTATSLVSDIYNWKFCRGAACTPGTPCPLHNPIDYCGVDAWAGIIVEDGCAPILAEHNVPESLLRAQHDVAEVCHEMEERGIRVNLNYVRSLDASFEARKAALFPVVMEGKKEVYHPFNPKSPKGALDWFASQGFSLKSAEKVEVLKALEKQAKKECAEFEYGEKKEILGFKGDADVSEILDALLRFYLYKNEGKGLDPWFGTKYLHDVAPDKSYGFLHARIVSVGTSTGRLSSSRPNLTNVPARGFGELVRQGIEPRDPENYDLIKADYGQLELRCVLWLGGQPYTGSDPFTWMVKETGESFLKMAALVNPTKYAIDPMKAAREIAKSVAYGNLYGEGMVLVDPGEIKFGKIKREIDAGALRLYTKGEIPWLEKDWIYFKHLVGFTGVNMAERIFGEATLENRRKALEIQEDIFFNRFSVIRQWQKLVMDEIERYGYAKGPDGHFTQLPGMAKDSAKAGLSVVGQGTSAFHVRAVIRRYRREQQRVPYLIVHDELVFENPKHLTDEESVCYIKLMEEETDLLPGFRCPIEAKRGPNWKEMRVIYKG